MAITIPPWSYTHLDTFDQCPHKYYHKFILKIKEEKTQEMLKGTRDHEALEKRVVANIALPSDLSNVEPMCQSIISVARAGAGTIRTEMKVAINRDMKPTDFFAKDVYGRGALDVSILMPEANPTAMWIGDWKTGKPSEKDFQVSIFAFFGFLHYPTVQKIKACNLWLQTMQPGKVYSFGRGDMPRIWSEIYIKLAAMENAAASEQFAKCPGPLCAYCPVTTCENWRPRKK